MYSFFDLLDMPLAWELDLGALESAYLTKQRQWHPDRFVGKPEAEKANALVRSAQINQGYQVLKNPLSRAEHLLHLKGVETPKETVQDPEMLMEVMEYQEMLLEGDSSVAQKLAEALGAVEQSFGGDIQAQNWEEAVKGHSKMAYLTKLMADAENLAA